jgi:hypothetical protein
MAMGMARKTRWVLVGAAIVAAAAAGAVAVAWQRLYDAPLPPGKPK